MLFAFMLASALAATTAVLGRSTESSPALQMTLVEEDQIEGQYEETRQILATDDRSSNLKYVMAIQSSSIWTEIKKRSLTINAPQGLNDVATDKSPENLSDAELALLKQACHDGLKCVAVDQLLVLNSVREPLGDGYTSVRTAITKITEVITQYTDEYHEDVYEYEAVTQSDDSSKVYESVTTIVEDNKELCQIDVAAPTTAGESYREQVVGYADGGSNTGSAPPQIVNNDVTINYNEIGNYNVNNGTVNSANIEIPPTADGAVVTMGTDDLPKNRSSDRRYGDAVNGTSTGDKTDSVKSVKNDAGRNDVRGSGMADRHAEPVSTANDRTGYAPPLKRRQPLAIADGPSGNSGSADTGDANKNAVTLDNSAGSGHNESDADIVSAGSNNKHDIRKGMVEDGYFNNGNMKVKNSDHSNRNKGTIKDSNVKNGILNVGTVNNGPVNYGTASDYTNNGTVADLNSFDVQKYANSIDQMYSAILNKLAAKQ
ncbi:uncharacterized protein LOC112603141 [Melanaphis sacchari]|uniref:uncharacterized protein LOC112603141 n=1 Tax=Melanaphis sacchari TaxID=742174 RepID=UPI000DC152EB|nr:uncharacterized protein LOC112603141 [Melanaphis sacchari]